MGVLTVGALIEQDTIFWLPSRKENALFLMDLNQGNNAKYITSFENGEKENSWIIQKVISWNGKKYFFSRHSYEVWILDEKYQMQHYKYSDLPVNIITDIEIIENNVWIFSQMLKKPILIVNLIDMSVSYMNFDIPMKYEDFGFTRTIQIKGHIYFATREENKILLGDIDCKKRKIGYQLLEQLKYVNCIGFEESLYILGALKNGMSALLQFDINSKKIIEFYELQKTVVNQNMSYNYTQMIGYEDNVIFLPNVVEQVIVFNLKDKKEEIILYPKKFYYDTNKLKEGLFWYYQISEKYLYFFPHLSEQILCLNLEGNSIDVLDVEINLEEYEQILKKMNSILEYKNVNLVNLIRYLKKYQKENSIIENNFGKGIYSLLNRE